VLGYRVPAHFGTTKTHRFVT